MNEETDTDNKASNLPSPTTSDSSYKVPPAQTVSETTDDNWLQDTVHYLSPVTTVRTLYEGDFDYAHFEDIFGVYEIPSISSGSTVSCEEPKLQRTIAIIKPEAMIFKDVVLKTVVDNGFSIVAERTVHLTPEQVAEIYAQHYGCPGFPNMVVSMSIGPLLVLSMARFNAIEKWKSMVGPYKMLQAEWFLPFSVRKRIGMHVEMADVLHASENLKESNMENRYFYPRSTLEPIICEDHKVEDYCNLHINPVLSKGLAELVRKKPVDPVIFLAEWLLINNPCQPTVPYNYAMAPT